MKQKPNLLFIYTDQQAIDTLATYGNHQIEMSNLNKLTNESIVFEKAFVTQPVCTPSRASLLTGLYPHSSGCIENNIPLPEEITCLPEMMSDSNYVTAHFGKWHLGDEIFPQHGFDEWRSIEELYSPFYSSGRDRSKHSDYHDFLIAGGISPKNGSAFSRAEFARLPEKFSKPKFLADQAVDFLSTNKENPFILYINFLEPHMPYFGPRDNQYNPEDIPLPDNFNNEPGEEQHVRARIFKETYYEQGYEGYPLKTASDWQRLKAKYWGLCSQVDMHAGRILQTVDDLGLREDTIVVFTSDHGDMMGSHRLLAKMVMYEEAVRVPFIMRVPGYNGGKRIAGPVSQIDIVPTLLELMEQEQVRKLDGESLVPILNSNSSGRTGRDVFIEWNGSNVDIQTDIGNANIQKAFNNKLSDAKLNAALSDPLRTIVTEDGWKYIRSQEGKSELYNLGKDPGEKNNLVEEPEYGTLINELQVKIVKWQKKTGDKEKY